MTIAYLVMRWIGRWETVGYPEAGRATYATLEEAHAARKDVVDEGGDLPHAVIVVEILVPDAPKEGCFEYGTGEGW